MRNYAKTYLPAYLKINAAKISPKLYVKFMFSSHRPETITPK